MAKKKTLDATVTLPFFEYLWGYYAQNRRSIRKSYKDLTGRILDYNDPENRTSFLRTPQFEAFEMYVFLKEYLDNPRLADLMDDWRNDRGKFQRKNTRTGEQGSLFESDENAYQQAFDELNTIRQDYANYIFALTMGVGKTILMATCVFYEFLLANKYPHDERFCQNVIVFAPDTTVLQSLKEIQEFDRSKVIPAQYASWLDSQLKFHFLDEAGITLNTLDSSSFNVVISNSQKIIRKRKNAEKTATQLLFETNKFEETVKDDPDADMYETDDEEGLSTNQRFQKLARLHQLGIYVDEAHHAFGKSLKRDIADHESKTSLRLTIDLLAKELKDAGTRVVACYNFTGTPYVENKLMPEVVYAYSLKDAITHEYLKTAKVEKVTNAKSLEFIRNAIQVFIKEHGEKRYEGMLPKMAIFATTIDELTQELKPAVEKAVVECGLSPDSILVNVGDEKHTGQDDIKEFRSLDSKDSEKQFILLVGKGKEGWNCRSLFSVALFREPKSKIFVLQATMRCLRSITDVQQEGHVFLSEDNYEILSKELEANFRISMDEFQSAGESNKRKVIVKVRKPPVYIDVIEKSTMFKMKERKIEKGFQLGLCDLDAKNYRIVSEIYGVQDLTGKAEVRNDLSFLREDIEYTPLMLVAEIARYLNKSPIEIEEILELTQERIEGILEWVNQANRILFEIVIPRLFKNLYEIKEFTGDPQVIRKLLVKEPPEGDDGYEISVNPDLFAEMTMSEYAKFEAKSFHLTGYGFDSLPEFDFFKINLSSDSIKKIWFTGMLTHGQTEFNVHYIDPETNSLRTYYPDFLIELVNGSYLIAEVKGEHLLTDPVTMAKIEYAREMAEASKMQYVLVPGMQAGQKVECFMNKIV